MKRRNKYNVAAVSDRTIDGITFDSRAEMLRWLDLQLLERAGKISHLRRQVEYPLVVNGIKVGIYEADFVYRERGVEITEDWKGVRTAVFQLKRQLMKAIWGIDILITEGTKRRPAKTRLPTGRHRSGVLSGRQN